MITQTIKYFDYDENEVTKDFSFHLDKLEVQELTETPSGDKNLLDIINTIGDDTSISEVLDLLKVILKKAVGRRTETGFFIKDQQAIDELFATDAYSELVFNILSEPKEAVAFMNGIMPKALRDEIKKTISDDDLDNLSPEELREKMKELRAKGSK